MPEANEINTSIFSERTRNKKAEKTLIENGIDPLRAKIFANRGISKIEEIRATLDDMLDLYSLKNVEKGASLLADCREKQSRVCIVSDYDCDGATACATLLEAFSDSGMNVGFLVPDREIHGYGLTESIVDDVAKLDPRPEFIVTVDAGISSNAGVKRAAMYGIKVIITDHHLPPPILPEAELIINPNQLGDTFQSKNIAGCGVAWYLATAYYVELCDRNIEPNFEPEQLLPYVALGTIADVVTLDKNNRILVSEGLSLIRKGQCSPGIIALANIGKREFNIEDLSTQDIGFQIGPRINAAGRLKNMTAGILCLTTKDESMALALASDLDATNEERKQIQEEMLLESEKLSMPSNQNIDKKSVIVFCPDFHKGVVGIVAGKLKDANYLPAFVLTQSSTGDFVGSGRSIPGFHLKHALDEVNINHPNMLQKFGGHAMAAGLTINKGFLQEFKDAFESVCEKHLTPEILIEKIEHDGELSPDNFSMDQIKQLNSEVWGQGFLAPMFINKILVTEKKLLGGGKHLKLSGKLNDTPVSAIAFSKGGDLDHIDGEIEVAFQPQINTFNGKESLQLQVSYFPSIKYLSDDALNQKRFLEDMKQQEMEQFAKIKSEESKIKNAEKVKNRKIALDSKFTQKDCNIIRIEDCNIDDGVSSLIKRVHTVRSIATGEPAEVTQAKRDADRRVLRMR